MNWRAGVRAIRRSGVQIFTGLSLALLAAYLVGCGGAGGTSMLADAIVPATESRYSDDAKILTQRQTTSGPWLSSTRAAAFDADLQAIRAKYPANQDIQNIHAFPEFILTDISFTVHKSAPWVDRWRAGIVMTGNPRVDALLAKYNVIQMTYDFEIDSDPDASFYFQLGQSLNVKAILGEFPAASAQIVSANFNGTGSGGEPDNIFFQNGSYPRRYAFLKGIGDTGGHTYEFTITNDGTITLKEYDGFPPFGRARIHKK